MKTFLIFLIFSNSLFSMDSDGSSDRLPLLGAVDAEAGMNSYQGFDELLDVMYFDNAQRCVDYVYGPQQSKSRNALYLKQLLLRRASGVALDAVLPRVITRGETDRDVAFKDLIRVLVESQRAETEAEQHTLKIMKERWEAEKADRLVQARKARRAMIINGITVFYSTMSTLVNFLQAFNILAFGERQHNS